MNKLGYLIAAALGALVTYLLDPVSGRGRRARLRDQSAARLRDAAEETAARARYESGRIRGVMHELGDHDDDAPADDDELLQKVRSEAVGPSGADAGDIEVNVEDGEVVLRGTMTDPGATRELVTRVESVTGVRRVRNEISRG